ncbi:MAG: hypothetical protein J5J06_07535 [Phycisphaerae bacterium]|nr:hypothetical protein [Phycisphaerae bacterium]
MRMLQLSDPWQRLVGQCQRINFGRITLHVRNGEPDLDSPWSTQRTVKLASGDNDPRPERHLEDFELRREHLALLDALKPLVQGERVTVDVRHGLPFIVEIEQRHVAV